MTLAPVGHVSLQTALARFTKRLWGDAEPIDDLNWYFDAAVNNREHWAMVPGSPLWKIARFGEPANEILGQLGSGSAIALAGHLPEGAALMVLSELKRRGLQYRIEQVLQLEPLAPLKIMIEAGFRTGDLKAVDGNGRYLEPEAWMTVEEGYGGGVGATPQGLDHDWRALYVDEKDLENWTPPPKSIARHKGILVKTLQTLVLIDAISMEGYLAVAASWEVPDAPVNTGAVEIAALGDDNETGGAEPRRLRQERRAVLAYVNEVHGGRWPEWSIRDIADDCQRWLVLPDQKKRFRIKEDSVSEKSIGKIRKTTQ